VNPGRYPEPEPPPDPRGPTLTGRARLVAIVMGAGVGLDALLGVAAIVAVPYRRHNAAVPTRGAALYLAHAVLGFVLTAAGVAIVGRWRRVGRPAYLAALTGVIGLAVAGIGGVLATLQATRLVGMGLMLLGAVAAVAGYLVPAFDAEPAPPMNAPPRRPA
jgi:hypothetical protein